MRGDKYIDLLDKIKCSPDFRSRMEEKLSADRTEVHEYYDVVRDVEKAPDNRRTKGFIPLFAAGAAIVCVFAVMVLSVKELPQDDEDRAASVTETTTTEENVTEETTAPEKYGTVVDLFAANDWICGGVKTMPIEFVSSDSSSGKTLTAENCDILELRDKLFNNDWSEISGFDSSNYYKIGTIMINQKGQISDGVNHFKLIKDKSYEISESAKKAFTDSETFNGIDIYPELFINFSWEMEKATVRRNVSYCADKKPFIKNYHDYYNTIQLGQESMDLKPIIEVMLNADWKQDTSFDGTEYFDIGGYMINSKGQVKFSEYYWNPSKTQYDYRDEYYVIDEESAKKIDQLFKENFWDKLEPQQEILKKIIKSGSKYNKMSADVKVSYYSLWSGEGNSEWCPENGDEYYEALKKRKTLTGEGKLYLDLEKNTEKIKIEGKLPEMSIPVTASLERDEENITYKESSEGKYNIDKQCVTPHEESYEGADGKMETFTYYDVDIPYLDYSDTVYMAVEHLTQYQSGYTVKVLTDDEKKDSDYDVIISSGDDDNYNYNMHIGLDEKTGVVDKIYSEWSYVVEDGTQIKEVKKYELENIKYNNEVQEIK